MATPEPDSNLWNDVRQYTQWPTTDELIMQDLARAWSKAGAAFEAAAQPPDTRLQSGWGDGNGSTFRDKIVALNSLVFANGARMKHLGWLAEKYGYDIGHTKAEIRKYIDGNDATYDKMNGIFGLFADTEGRQNLVKEVADAINEFLRQMEERIASRGRGGPELPKPVFTRVAPGELGLGTESIPPFPNQLPRELAGELETARRLGVKPLEPGTQEFDDLINTGEKLKWAVLEDGRLVVIPKYVHGTEIKHSVLSGGAPVRAAGEVEIAGGGGSYYGLALDNVSGHFRPSAESLAIGREAFRRYGIEFN
jgi:hypothetical protein